jgi:hypothetical protein
MPANAALVSSLMLLAALQEPDPPSRYASLPAHRASLVAPEEGISLSVPEKQPERALRIGDSVPVLSVSEWIADGTPQPPRAGFQPGTAYVLVFFSPNQRPIKNLFDSISNLSDRFRDRLVRVIGVTGPSKSVARADLTTVLDSYKHYVRFPIAWDDATKTRDAFLTAMGGHKEPLVAVIDPRGRVAWYGAPGQTTQILNAILADQWNIDAVRQQIEHTEDMAWLRIEIVRAQRAKDPRRMLAAGEKLKAACAGLGDQDRAELLGFANDVSGNDSVFDLTANKDLARLARTLAEQAISDHDEDPRTLAIVARARFADGDTQAARTTARRALEILGSKVPTDNDLLEEIRRDFVRFSK